MKKKKKRTCLKSSQQELFSSTKQVIIAEPDFEFYLPDECWELVFKLNRDFNCLSLVSKHFLSITNRLIFSLLISKPPPCSVPRFFLRFFNLNTLRLWFGSRGLDAGIASALRDAITLKSLSISRIDLKDAKYVTSQYIDSIMSLKGLNNLELWGSQISNDLLYSIAREGLPLKSFVLQNCTGYSYDGIYCLLSKCQEIRHLGIQSDDFLKDGHIVRLSLLLPDLESINLSKCRDLTESSLFALIRNCHSLREIIMEHIYIMRDEGVHFEDFDSAKNFDVNPQLKFLRLAHNSFINSESIIFFGCIFPNLELLDLSCCDSICEEGICQVLSICSKVRHLNLAYCHEVRRLKMNFVVPQLEVLNLSGTSVDDKTLYEISKNCCGLLQLLLRYCHDITKNGVTCIVESCTQLKEIDLTYCCKVNTEDAL